MPVVDVACGRDSTVAVTGFRRDPRALEEHYRRAVAADPSSADTLRLLPGYAAAYDRLGQDYRDEATRAREEAARHPPSPRTMRRLRNRELQRLQRERQARREEAAMEQADDAARRARGRMAKRRARHGAVEGALAEAAEGAAAAGETAALWDMPDAEGPREWRREAVRAARALLDAEDCMQAPEESGCPLCFSGSKCAACRFHSRWVVPYASRDYGRRLAARQRREAELAERTRRNLEGGGEADAVLRELEAQREEAARDADAGMPAYRQWPLRDVVEAVLTEAREGAGEMSDDSDLDEQPRPVRVDAARAERALGAAARSQTRRRG